MQKIRNIEFLRILFAFFIFILHFTCCAGCSSNVITSLAHSYTPSMLIVIFFFLVSGYFFAYTYKEQSFFDFIKRKVNRLFPTVAFFVLCMYAISQYNIVNYSPYEGFLSLLFLNSVGISSTWGLTAWFTSVLFWGLLFFYGLRNTIKDDKVFNFVTSLIVFFTFVAQYSYISNGISGANQIINGFISVGMLQSISNIGLGILIYNFIKILPEYKATKKSRIIYSIIEFLVFGWIIITCTIDEIGVFSSFIYNLFFALLLLLFILKRGILSQFFDKDWCVVLGKYSFSLYMIHWAVIKFLMALYWFKNPSFISQHPYINISIVIFIMLIITYLTYNFVEKENKYRKYIFLAICIIALIPVCTFRNMTLKPDKIYKFDRINPYVYITNRYDIDWAAFFEGSKTRVNFRLPKGKYKIIFKFYPYVNETHKTQNVIVFYKNKKVALYSLKYNKPLPETSIIIDSKRQFCGYTSIKFEMPDAVSPAEIKTGDDHRKYSVALENILIKKIEN